MHAWLGHFLTLNTLVYPVINLNTHSHWIVYISWYTTWFYSAFGSSPPKMKYLLAVFVILESFLSIEAAAGKTLYFRSFNHLWKIKISVLKNLYTDIFIYARSMHTCILTKISIRFIFGLFTFLVDFLKKNSFTVEFCFISCLQVKQDIIDILCIFFSHPNRIEKKNIEYRICQLFAPKIYWIKKK